MRITIRDIARMTELSTATVSRVLNNKPDVSEEARKKVTEAMSKHNYNPNSVARSLAMNKTNTIGLILPDITNPFFPELARGVENKAKEHGYSVILYDINNDNHELLEAVNVLRAKKVDGIIMVQWSSVFVKDLESVLGDDETPIVAIDREDRENYVNFDNHASAFKAVQFLVKNGHSRIAHLSGDMNTLSGQRRHAGYLQALKEAGITPDSSLIWFGNYTIESGREGMKTLLDLSLPPSAVFAANDMIAIGAYEAVHDAGLSIPEDVSVVGHDDIAFSALIRPALTTVVVPRYELGVACVEVLNSMIRKKSEELFPHNLESSLKIRSSVRRLA
jgi:LacI family transcriptional regulator